MSEESEDYQERAVRLASKIVRFKIEGRAFVDIQYAQQRLDHYISKIEIDRFQDADTGADIIIGGNDGQE
jgi:lysyl-tRNA synthetase class II